MTDLTKENEILNTTIVSGTYEFPVNGKVLARVSTLGEGLEKFAAGERDSISYIDFKIIQEANQWVCLKHRFQDTKSRIYYFNADTLDELENILLDDCPYEKTPRYLTESFAIARNKCKI